MRLINIHTLVMQDFPDNPPRYAILSHRWTGSEITFEEWQSPEQRAGASFQKAVRFCELIKHLPQRMIDHVWIDTCCIDKRSSAELTESVNSMYAWYQSANLCVAYLVDVTSRSDGLHEESICNSEWFTRGWTLQELITPHRGMLFCTQDWQIIGCKGDLADCLSKASGIPVPFLLDWSIRLRHASVAEQMSWASHRRTTRREDQAYCLFGLFQVNLPLLYGEGLERAFMRLQKEILQQSDDDSIFAWSLKLRRSVIDFKANDLLASSPHDFHRVKQQVVRLDFGARNSFSVTKWGIDMATSLTKLSESDYLLHLNCGIRTDGHDGDSAQCALVLQKLKDGTFLRRHFLEDEKQGEWFKWLNTAADSCEVIENTKIRIRFRWNSSTPGRELSTPLRPTSIEVL